MRRVCLVVGVIGVLACGGGNEKPPFIVKAPPNNSRDASVEEIVDAGGGGTDAGVVSQNGPLLEFTAPAAAQSPTDDTVITSRDVTVRCRVKPRPGSKASVDRASIKITLDKNPEGTSTISAPIDALPDDEYEAKFDLSTLSNGRLRFHCEAKDLASTPESSSIALETLLDLGPKIELFTPKDKGVYALEAPVAIQFQVDPAPIGNGDSEAEIKRVRLQVSGLDIPLTESADKPGLYQASVDFDNQQLFKVPPTASEVLITAENGRTPDAAVRVVKADIAIDGAGPTITVMTPTDTALVHGEVTLRISVTDTAGVAPRSLKAVINSDLLEISDWNVNGSVYEQVFDTRKFGTELTQLTINITATDLVGNQTRIPHVLRLDNLPPVLSLNPPVIREWRKTNNKYYCSTAFDPVGADATDDLDRVRESSMYRVLVEDQTNHSPGANIDYLAGVSPSDVMLYAQPDPGIPLLIDSDGNGLCDEINSAKLPEAQRPTQIKLTAVISRGAAWYPKPVNYDASNPEHVSGAGFCEADPAGADASPDALCTSTPMTRVVAGRSQDKPPAVYGFNPSNNSLNPCTGETWALLEIVKEGWACVAARAVDRIGNVGVSEALRVCFDRQDGGGDPCADPAPNCNKDCSISDAQRYAPNEFWEQR